MKKLRFLDRAEELRRVRRALRQSTFICLYGRRRCGKSRLVLEALRDRKAVHYTADEREPRLQLQALAAVAARVVPGFDRVEYPGWDELFHRLFAEMPRDCALVIDELPYLVAQIPALPSVLQKYVERNDRAVVVLGSSQRMMQGLVLDASAPLYGRAAEIMKVEPLGIAELCQALGPKTPREAVRHWATWGGVPRYWELAREHRSWRAAVREHVLDPLAVLHREPVRLLQDDMRDIAQASSILQLVGAGCHRLTEIAGRLAKPATSLSRPLERLCDLGLLRRERPFGTDQRETKRSLYRIPDPFLTFWYRFVEPNASRLAVGDIAGVMRDIERGMPQLVGDAWEVLVRRYGGTAAGRWTAGARYWDGSMELDVLAPSPDGKRVLVGEAKRSCTAADVDRTLLALEAKIARCPPLRGKQTEAVIFALDGPRHPRVFDGRAVLRAAGCSI